MKGGLQRPHLSSDLSSTHTDEEERECILSGSGTKTSNHKHSINTNFNNTSTDNYYNGHNVHNNNTENHVNNTGEEGSDPKKKRRRRATDSSTLASSPSGASNGPHTHRGSTGSWDSGAKRSRALQALRANVYFALPQLGYEVKDKEKDKDKDKEKDKDKDLHSQQVEMVKNRRQGSLAAVVKALQHYASNHPLSPIDSNADSENTETKEKSKPKPKPKKEKEYMNFIDTSMVTGALLTPSVMSNSGPSGIYYAGAMGMKINPTGPMGGLRLSHPGTVGSNLSGSMDMSASGPMGGMSTSGPMGGMSASGPMGGMSASGPMGGMSTSSSASNGTTAPSSSYPYLLLSSPSHTNSFAAPIPSPALISIFSPGTSSVHGYTSKPLPSAVSEVIDLKTSSERERERARDRDRDRDRDMDTVYTGDPFNNSNESSYTTGDTDNGANFDNKKMNSSSSHSSMSTKSSDTSQNIDDKDGLLALEGLLSLSKY